MAVGPAVRAAVAKKSSEKKLKTAIAIVAVHFVIDQNGKRGDICMFGGVSAAIGERSIASFEAHRPQLLLRPSVSATPAKNWLLEL